MFSVKSEKITHMMSQWCHKGCLFLGLETAIFKQKAWIKQTRPGVYQVGRPSYQVVMELWEMSAPVFLELYPYMGLKVRIKTASALGLPLPVV